MSLRQPRARGFTLTELVAVIAIISILAGAATPAVIRAIEIREERLTESQLRALEEGLTSFYRDHGRFPTEAEGLVALIEDSGASAWRGPYIEPGESTAISLSDARGATLEYEDNGNSVTLTAPGFDSLSRTTRAISQVQEWAQLAQQELSWVNQAAERYRIAQGSYPGDISDLVPLWLGADFGTDPWGTGYVLDSSRSTFASAGPNQTWGDTDDIFPVGLGGTP